MVVVTHAGGRERAGTGGVHLGVGAQVDDIAHVQLPNDPGHIGRAQILQMFGTDQPPGRDHPAVARGQAAQVAHIGDAVEVDPPVHAPKGRPGIGEGLGKYEFPRPSSIPTEVEFAAPAEAGAG